MTFDEVMAALKKSGNPQTHQTHVRHGAPADSSFGVKIGDLKPIQKKIRGQQQLALQLYATGNSDAMYLAGLVADGAKMTKTELNRWASQATWYMLADYTVPWVASESPHGMTLALKWIDSRKPLVVSAGWSTLAAIVAVQPDDQLDIRQLQSLLERVVTKIHDAPNRPRASMNNFVIATGCYVSPLLKQAKEAATRIGKVVVDVGDTACKIPSAMDYITKVESMGRIGQKRKTVKC
ncbi:MAG: DNA alkylation repair protein [Planctomycetaceae bacterium]|nr:DNA alkylation repair protein [Planctomycetaceae bacterium]